eukprot:Skav231998  [mRNA]  locus=scaffold719:448670:469014:- [translate_table: standard]
MSTRTVQANTISLNSAVSALAVSRWQDAVQPFAASCDVVTFNARINALEKASCWRDSSWLLHFSIRDAQLEADAFSFAGVMSSAAQAWRWESAAALLKLMGMESTTLFSCNAFHSAFGEAAVDPVDIVAQTIGVLNPLTASCHAMWPTERACKLPAVMAAKAVANVLEFFASNGADAAGAGRWSDLQHSYDRMSAGRWAAATAWQRCLSLLGGGASRFPVSGYPDKISFSSAVTACCETARWQIAIELFQRMKDISLPLNTVIFAELARACASGLQWKATVSIVGEMCRAQCEPDALVVASSVDVFQSSGQANGNMDSEDEDWVEAELERQLAASDEYDSQDDEELPSKSPPREGQDGESKRMQQFRQLMVEMEQWNCVVVGHFKVGQGPRQHIKFRAQSSTCGTPPQDLIFRFSQVDQLLGRLAQMPELRDAALPRLPPKVSWRSLVSGRFDDTFLEGPSSDCNDDDISLAVAFQGLQITVCGPARRALDFVHKLAPDQVPPSGAGSSSGVTATSSSAVTPCPANLCALASRLSAASVLSPEDRVRRAWLAGLHAKAKLEGTVAPSEPVVSIDLPAKFFVALRGEHLPEPKIFRNAADYYKCVQPASGCEGVGKEFPSETEARVFLAGAGVFQPYAVDLSEAGVAEEEDFSSFALVVLVRPDGIMLALPEHSVNQENLDLGRNPGFQGLVGPSTMVEVAAAIIGDEDITAMPLPGDGRVVRVLLVDFTLEIVSFMRKLTSKVDVDLVHSYDLFEPSFVPTPADLLTVALAWVGGVVEGDSERLQFYSADETQAEPTPTSPTRRPTRRRAGPGGSGGQDAQRPAPKRRPTVASLAEALEAISLSLPGITSQLQDLSARTAAMEAGGPRTPDRPSALRVPLGTSAMAGLSATSSVSQLAKAIPPPPRSSSAPSKARVTFSQQEATELEEETLEGKSELAQAMLMQSKAIQALVTHLATNATDPMNDLSSTSSAISSKGALGRAKLQAELAAHKGVFFNQVLHGMARRMQPAQPSEVEMSALVTRGVTPTTYLERFGGFGKSKDLGMIIWQVALAMNHIQEGNHLAAQDSLALLFVCLEQAAMDGGNLQIGLLLSLTEDPPQSLFSGRSLASQMHPRPFAPTAHQRWVTTALQYLKEMDVITTKRAEATNQSRQQGDGGAAPSTPAPTNPGAKKKGKGRGNKKSPQKETTEED